MSRPFITYMPSLKDAENKLMKDWGYSIVTEETTVNQFVYNRSGNGEIKKAVVTTHARGVKVSITTVTDKTEEE